MLRLRQLCKQPDQSTATVKRQQWEELLGRLKLFWLQFSLKSILLSSQRMGLRTWRRSWSWMMSIWMRLMYLWATNSRFWDALRLWGRRWDLPCRSHDKARRWGKEAYCKCREATPNLVPSLHRDHSCSKTTRSCQPLPPLPQKRSKDLMLSQCLCCQLWTVVKCAAQIASLRQVNSMKSSPITPSWRHLTLGVVQRQHL